MTSLREMGEKKAIKALAARLGVVPDGVCVGIGDDCAVVRENDEYDTVLTSDPLIQNTHFTLETAPERIGHKAVGRVLSDLAAMGSVPLWILINVVATDQTEIFFLERIYDGMNALCQHMGASIIGGDLAHGPALELHVFGVGRVPRGQALCRSGAGVNDKIYVTGDLGGSLLGHHLDFEPRIQEAIWLRENRWAHALMDISDGLATDVHHIADMSEVGIRIDLPKIPVSDAASQMSDKQSSQMHALCDGEDFELLFTVDADKAALFEQAWQDRFNLACICVGEVTPAMDGIVYIDQTGQTIDLACAGYEHFTG